MFGPKMVFEKTVRKNGRQYQIEEEIKELRIVSDGENEKDFLLELITKVEDIRPYCREQTYQLKIRRSK